MKLSVVIPAYNRTTLLAITLRSLLAQERVADEILVVDDGSTDGTAEVAAAFGPPVRVIRQVNQGPGAARNRGLAEAKGEFIHFFDSDDLALPNLHRIQLEALERSNADVAYSPWVKARLDPLHGVHPTNHMLQAGGLPPGSLARALLTNWSTVPMVWLLRRRLAEGVGGFPTNLLCGEDQLFFLGLLLANARVVHTPETLVLYRDEPLPKLSTASTPEAQQRRSRDWGFTLVMARRMCQAKGVDPAAWFGFRRRALIALQDMRASGDSSAALQEDLTDILNAFPLPPALYQLSRMLQQKGEGLTARLFNRRAHRCFRSAPLTAAQRAGATEALAAAAMRTQVC
ncbi:MAG: glycosyltransferase family 2 protein [Cyanobium sp. M30B3]|nr:MAG: glycosyltransferase family 2 protein [Cyanobium sp. M30B3]